MKGWIFAGLLTALLLAGCGGNSGGDLNGNSGNNGNVGGGGGGGVTGTALTPVFLTDDPTTAYSAVWVTIRSVTLNPGSSAVYSDPTGTTVNLRTLRDTTGALFQYLSSATLGAGPYTSATVVLDSTLTMVPTGSTSGQTYTFAGASNGVVSLPFTLKQSVTPGNYVVVDFDLSQWTVNGSTVTPVLTDGSQSGDSNPSRHVACGVTGLVSALTGTAPVQAFTLTFGASSSDTLSVSTSATTTIFNADGSSAPMLANGDKVTVDGKWDPTNNLFAASQVRILPAKTVGSGGGTPPILVGANGIASNVSSSTYAFDLTINQVFGAQPGGSIVHIGVAPSAKFFGKGGLSISESEFFTLLNGATSVEVAGTINSSTQTLTAVLLQVFNTSQPATVDAGGQATNVSSTNSSFDITLNDFEGFAGHPGQSVSVVTNSSTTFTGPDDTPLTSVQFFDDLGNNPNALVFASGTFDTPSQTITATSVSYAPAKTVPWAVIAGTVASFSATADTLSLSTQSWQDCNASSGALVPITVNSTTTYNDSKGISITESAFFADVRKGAIVTATGSLIPGAGLTATNLRIGPDPLGHTSAATTPPPGAVPGPAAGARSA